MLTNGTRAMGIRYVVTGIDVVNGCGVSDVSLRVWAGGIHAKRENHCVVMGGNARNGGGVIDVNLARARRNGIVVHTMGRSVVADGGARDGYGASVANRRTLLDLLHFVCSIL